jgi:hypothetical protein
VTTAGSLELFALRPLPGAGHRLEAELTDEARTYRVPCTAADLAIEQTLPQTVAAATGRAYRPATAGERWLTLVLRLLDQADRDARYARASTRPSDA